ncbi:MAG: hypothetical protein KUG58_06010 [Marinosulfonomonas sp.]|nr:hypothetical protein [Marinosulfonomonas sp.]
MRPVGPMPQFRKILIQGRPYLSPRLDAVTRKALRQDCPGETQHQALNDANDIQF